MDRFIRTNFDEFVTTAAFYELPLSDFSNYLKHRNLKTETEETVLSAVVRWCRHNKLWNDFSGVYFQGWDYLSTNYFAIIFRDFFFKGIYSDKETKFEKNISLSVLTLLSNVKTKRKISSIFVAFSENLNFIIQAIILLDK